MAILYWAGSNGAPAGMGGGVWENPSDWATDTGLTQQASHSPALGDTAHFLTTYYPVLTTDLAVIDADVFVETQAGFELDNTAVPTITFTGNFVISAASEVYSNSNELVYARNRQAPPTPTPVIGIDGMYYPPDNTRRLV